MAPKENAAAYLRMVFTTNSLRNTTLSVEDDTLYYEIVTHFWHPHLTKIFKLDVDTREMILVAEIERVPGSNVRVRFGGEEAEWTDELDFMSWDLEKRWACNGGVFTGGDGVEYRWKSHRQRLQLMRANDDAKVPVAQYHTYRRHFVFFRMSRHAFLEIKPEETVEGLEKVIVSYLLVEGGAETPRNSETIYSLFLLTIKIATMISLLSRDGCFDRRGRMLQEDEKALSGTKIREWFG